MTTSDARVTAVMTASEATVTAVVTASFARVTASMESGLDGCDDTTDREVCSLPAYYGLEQQRIGT